MLLVIIILNVFNFLWGERTPASNGLGWDGVTYADLVRNIDVLISSNQLSNYYAHRSLPAIVVRAIIQLFQIPMSDINIIKTFEVFNFTLLIIIFLTWKKISDHFNLSIRARWIAFCGLFLSFSISKCVLYLPVLTDVSGLLVGMLILYFYLKKRPFAIFVTALLGAFCWPGVAVTSALLLLFLNFELSLSLTLPDSSKAIIKNNMNGAWLKWGFVILVFSIILRPIARFLNPGSLAGSFFTGLPAFYFVIFGLLLLLESFSFFIELWRKRDKFSIKLSVLAMTTVIVPLTVGKFISNPDLPNWNTLGMLKDLILYPPDNKFLLAPLTLSLFWGPTFLLMLIFWKEVSAQIRKMGPGAMAVVALHLPLGLVCEPRFYTLIWPFLVVSLSIATEKIVFSQRFKKIFIILTILFSQFWLIINWGHWSPGLNDNLQEFPKQLLFMHLGLWMSWLMYLLQLPLVIFSGFLLHKTVVEIKN